MLFQAPARPACTLLRLGGVPYGQAWETQRALAEARREGRVGDLLLLLEHPHVFTLGRRGREGDILADAATLASLGAEVHHVDRGGEVTYHGPGQVVGYPILDIRPLGGPRRYVRGLEETIIRALADLGVPAERWPGRTGVWVRGEKIAAIGVRVSRGVTTHGFAVNVDPDLSYFGAIVPCGIPDTSVTSLARLLGCRVERGEVEASLARHFAQVFGFDLRERTDSLGFLASLGVAPTASNAAR